MNVAINKEDLQFKTVREMAIYEIAHTMGMMKREQEIQQEVTNSIILEDMKFNTIVERTDDRFRPHSEKWFAGMAAQINKIIELIKEQK